MGHGLQEREAKRKPEKRLWWLSLVLLFLALAVAAAVILFWGRVRTLEGYGYAGAFLISMLGNATILVPVPSLAAVFALGGMLKYPALVGVVAGLGMAIGELTGYMAGVAGRKMFAQNRGRFFSRLEGWMSRRGGITILLLAAFPTPFMDLAGAMAGSSRYSLWRFLLFCWMGKTVKGLMVAFAGAWGLSQVLRWLEPLGF